MKTFVILVVLLFAATAIQAQQVVASAGGSGKITGYSVDWTLGEPVIETVKGTNNMLTQGMHQTKLLVTAVYEIDFPGLEIKVYPNPAREKLFINVTQTGDLVFSYEVTDMTGQRKVLKEMKSSVEELDVRVYVPGMYLLRIFTPGFEYEKVYKIVKN